MPGNIIFFSSCKKKIKLSSCLLLEEIKREFSASKNDGSIVCLGICGCEEKGDDSCKIDTINKNHLSVVL